MQSRLQASMDAHHYFLSVVNIRIENWWSHSWKRYTGWLINFFKDMVATSELNLGNTLHMELAWHTFPLSLQCELVQVKLQWNTLTEILHILRKRTLWRMVQLLWMMLIKYLRNILNMTYVKRIYYILQLTGIKGWNFLYLFWKSEAHSN